MKRLIFTSLVLLLLVSCGRAEIEEEKRILSYSGPMSLTIKKGEKLPYAEISYLGPGPQGAEVLIKGQKAIKQRGDSLNWEGALLAEVEFKIETRITSFDSKALNSIGIFTVKITEPSPTPATPPNKVFLKFGVPVAYGVKRSEEIPGTTLRYAGKEAEGAKFEGLEGYPYRKMGDSLIWTGRLKEKVYLVLNVRVLHYDENTAFLSGKAEIILTH